MKRNYLQTNYTYHNNFTYKTIQDCSLYFCSFAPKASSCWYKQIFFIISMSTTKFELVSRIWIVTVRIVLNTDIFQTDQNFRLRDVIDFQ